MKINLNQKIDSTRLIELFNKLEYTNEEGIGFKNISIENEKIIVGYALKNTPIYINILKMENQQIEKREEMILSEIEFAIDLEANVLEVYANQKDFKKLFIVFSTLLKDVFTITPLISSLSSTILSIQKKGVDITITKMIIKDFQYKEGISGTFDMCFYDYKLAWSFLEKYQTEINKISFNIAYEGWEGKGVLGTSGKLKFNSKPKSNIHHFLQLLKSTIVETT